MVGSVIGVGLIGLALGIVGRLLAPHPRAVGVAICAAAGLVGGELGVLVVGAAGGPAGLTWIAGLAVAVVFVGAACGLILWRNGPYPPHDNRPRTIPDPDEEIRRRRT